MDKLSYLEKICHQERETSKKDGVVLKEKKSRLSGKRKKFGEI